MWGRALPHPEPPAPKPVPAPDPMPPDRWKSRFSQMPTPDYLPGGFVNPCIPRGIEFSSGAYAPLPATARIEKVVERTTHYLETAQALRRAWHVLNEARKRVQPEHFARECGAVADEIFPALQEAERETNPL